MTKENKINYLLESTDKYLSLFNHFLLKEEDFKNNIFENIEFSEINEKTVLISNVNGSLVGTEDKEDFEIVANGKEEIHNRIDELYEELVKWEEATYN